MKGHWSARHQRWVPDGETKTAFDGLPVPGGKQISQLTNGELAAALIKAGVDGVSHSQPRTQNLEAYAAFIGRLKQDAADRAANDWLKEHC